MSDEEKKATPPKLKLARKPSDSTEAKVDSAKGVDSSPSKPSEASSSVSPKSFKLKRPSSDQPDEAPPTKTPEAKVELKAPVAPKPEKPTLPPSTPVESQSVMNAQPPISPQIEKPAAEVPTEQALPKAQASETPLPVEDSPAPPPPEKKPTPNLNLSRERIAQGAAGAPIPTKKDAEAHFSEQMDTLEPAGKSSHLLSIALIGVLLLILVAAVAGIWYVLKDKPESAQTEAIAETKPASDETAKGPIGKSKEILSNAPADETPELNAAQNVAQEAPSAVTEEPEIVSEAADLKPMVTRFLNSAHIGGMRTGSNPRVMINEITYHVGDVVDANTELTFQGIRENRLLFRDKQGVYYTKSF